MSDAKDIEKVKRPTQMPLAIVGIGSMFPKAQDVERFWSNIKHGVDAITEIPDTHWNPDDYYDANQKRPDFTYGRRGGFLDPYPFNPMKYGIPPTSIEATDTSQLLGMVVAESAMENAGYGMDKDFDRSRVSVILGITGALEMVIPLGARLGHPQWRRALKQAGLDDATIEDAVQRISDSYVDWQENSFPGLLGNVVAGRISKYLNTGGTNCVVDAACASSLSALHLAALELESGKADMVITGGTDTFNDIFMYMCFSKTPALSPTGNSKPFDHNCDGTILGEGLGMVVMKRLDDAERDGDTIYAVVKGVGSSSDGKGDAIYAPSSPGQKKALEAAYTYAGVSPDTIELLEAHGTGTMKGDAVEAAALTEVYGKHSNGKPSWCALGSVKSQIGHTKSAAGAAGLIKAALGLHHKVLPPTIKVEKPADAVAPGATPFYVNTSARPWVSNPLHPRRAAVSAFGFGGSNFHMVMEEYSPKKTTVDWDGLTQIFAYSADTATEIQKQVAALDETSDWNTLRIQAKKSRESFESSKPCRLLFVLEQSKFEIAKLKETISASFTKQGDTAAWSTPDGIFYGYGKPSGTLGFIFPGQGAQYTGMLRDLACQFPEMIDALDLANSVVGEDEEGHRLSDRIFNHPTFDQESADRDTESLTRTDVAQPAIGTISLGAMKVLERFGIQPAAAAGHSYGELTALCAGSVLTPEGLIRASKLRGQLMGQGEGDRGSMLAVRGDIAITQQVIDSEKLDVIIANKNSPQQAVLSGSTQAIHQAKAAFDLKKITSTPLTVAAAFHSSLVADAAIPFAEGLGSIDFNTASIPVFSNTTGQVYPESAIDIRDLLANQLAKPVEFVNEIIAMHEAGVHTFVEVGPGARMTGLVKAILKDHDINAYALDASSGKKSGIADLARTLAQTAALGYPIDTNPWDDAFKIPVDDPGKKPKMIVDITGANYRSEQSKKKMNRPATPSRTATPPSAQVPAPKPMTQPAQTPTPASQQATVPPVTPAPIAQTQAPQRNAASIDHLLQQTQANIAALQQMQHQTAQLHAQFLEGQEQASKTFASLMQQQNSLMQSTGYVPQQVAPPVQNIPAPAAPVAPAPQPAPAPAPTPIAQPEISSAPAPAALLIKTLLAVVSEKTGYPEDMLEVNMSLDADLGIDSIKRVEILSALQEQIPELPTIEAEELGAIQTLQDIVNKLSESLSSESFAASPAANSASQDQLKSVLLDVVSEKTGYPVDMLDLDMSLDADLGIDSIKRVEILSSLQESMPELPSIEAEALGTLETLQDVITYLNAHAPVASTSTLPASVPGATLQRLLLEIVSEKTGYPDDMLDLDMSLDADLGIDSIKRVEILSALQEAQPSLPTVEAEVLGTLETLQDVINYLNAAAPSTPTISPSAPVADANAIRAALIRIVAEKTGYPEDMLEVEMSLDADLGIDSIKRVEILSALQEDMPDLPAVEAEDLGALETLLDVLNYLAEKSTAAAPVSTPKPTQAVPHLKTTAAHDQIQRQVLRIIDAPAKSARLNIPASASWVIVGEKTDPLTRQVLESLESLGYSASIYTEDNTAEQIHALLVIAPESGFDDTSMKSYFFSAQRAASTLLKTADKHKTIFATVSRMDGTFGFAGTANESATLSGGLAGFAKTAAYEWPTVTCRAIDIANTYSSVKVAASAIIEALTTDGPIEIGLQLDRTLTLELAEESIDHLTPATFSKSDVIVVSGGARGVTAEVAIACAIAGSPILILLGRSDAPEDEEPWLANCPDEPSIKQAIIKQSSKKLAPKDLESAYQSIARNRETTLALTRMKQAGSTVEYHAVDIRNADAITAVLSQVRATHGPITGIIHGAGVLADRFIADKTPEQFDSVYDTKVAGLRTLLNALETDPLKHIVLFSSSTGRFGRKGQVDYAIANEILNKWAHRESANRPDCNVVSVNWGPWAGGMVTPSLQAVFASEGIGLIGLLAGADYLLRELSQRGPIETVILGQAQSSTNKTSTAIAPTHTFALNIEDYPFLKSHVIDAKAVLPVAIYTEWFAHAALHANPGLHYLGIDDLRVYKGVRIEEHETLNLAVVADKLETINGTQSVRVAMYSGTDWSTLHARGTVRLNTKYEVPTPSIPDTPLGDYSRPMDEVYANGLLFHGEVFRGIESVSGYSESGIDVLAHPAPAPTQWITKPLRRKWVGDPLLLDCAFQALILWTFETQNAGSLPVAFKRLTQFQSSWPKGNVIIRARVTKHSAHQATATIEFIHEQQQSLLARIQDYECVIDASLNAAFERSHLASENISS